MTVPQDNDPLLEPPQSDVAAAFRRAWTGPADPASAAPELLPMRLARACATVLPIDGAGLSLHESGLRVPVGSSDEVATFAERLQFTQGEGPCIDSAKSRRIITADLGTLEERWPSFTDELVKHTPFRAVVSVPLAVTPTTFAALDLFTVDPAGSARLNLADVAAVGEEILLALAAADRQDVEHELEYSRSDSLPVALTTGLALARMHVWVAMGMLMTRYHLTATDALALLRSYAYGRDRLIDDVAAEVVDGGTDIMVEMRP